MNDAIHVDTESSYSLAEHKAAHYFAALYELVCSQGYEAELMKDFKQWKRKHTRNLTWLSRLFRNKRDGRDQADQRYIFWLEQQGKLDHYLERSVSYIYLRDLGKRLDQPTTRAKVAKAVLDIKN
jgi:hypothetical protein